MIENRCCSCNGGIDSSLLFFFLLLVMMTDGNCGGCGDNCCRI